MICARFAAFCLASTRPSPATAEDGRGRCEKGIAYFLRRSCRCYQVGIKLSTRAEQDRWEKLPVSLSFLAVKLGLGFWFLFGTNGIVAAVIAIWAKGKQYNDRG